MGVMTELYRRYLVYRHKPRHWMLRPDTIDRRVFRHVVIDNEYELPLRFGAADVILDVGGHIGSFALAALRRGAGKVVCCEPDADNFALLQRNLSPFGSRVELLHAAVWRSDRACGPLHFHNPLDRRNTGTGQVSAQATAQVVETVPFDDVVARAAGPNGRIRLLKLDCEGAEWPIVFTSQKLDKVDAICGEYHLDISPETFAVPGCDVFTAAALAERLQQAGFEVETRPMEPRPDVWGWFFARRV